MGLSKAESCRKSRLAHPGMEAERRRKKYHSDIEARLKRLASNEKWRDKNQEKAREMVREWARKNFERHSETSKKWRIKNPARQKELTNIWAKQHPDEVRAKSKKWKMNHPEKVRSLKTIRRAREIQAMPPWVKKEDLLPFYEEARRLTIKTGVLHVVDHIVPLKNHVVCGLHVPWNLSVLTSHDNAKKSNNLITELCSALHV